MCLGSSILRRQRERENVFVCVCVCVCVCLGTCRVWAPLSACSALCLWQHSCYKDGEGVAWPRPKRATLHLPGLQNRGCSGTQSFLHSGHAYWRSHRALLIGVGDTVIGAHVSDVGARSGILSFGSGEGGARREICTQRARCSALLKENDVFSNRVSR